MWERACSRLRSSKDRLVGNEWLTAFERIRAQARSHKHRAYNRTMKPKTMEMLAWVFIYGGGLLVIFALSVMDASVAISWTAKIMGIVAIVMGVFLVWLRSRSP
jgi:hypothetical protein